MTEIGGREVRITNPDKVLFPGDAEHAPTTKGELIDYYRAIAPTMLPHLAGRPVTRKRWPNGTDQPSFFTKNLDSGTPDWVPRAPIEHKKRIATYPLLQEEAALAWAAQLAAIELHTPQWRLPAPDSVANDDDETPPAPRAPYVLEDAVAEPDRLVVDLDPGPGTPMQDVAKVALAARDILEGAGLTVVPVTSGSKGIHLYAGLSGVSAEEAKAVSTELAKALEADLPDLVITNMKRSIRDGKVFVDHSQNNPAKTTVAPYSVRGRTRPWVAAPRAWSEIEAAADGEPLPQLTMPEVLERVARDGDLMAPLLPGGAAEVAAPGASGVGALSSSSVIGELPVPAIALADLPRPMLASTLTPEREAKLAAPDAGEHWLFEPKWDGYRVLVAIGPAREDTGETAVALVSRSGRDLTPSLDSVGHVPPQLAGHVGVLDAEVVALDDAGGPSFQRLQNRGANDPRLRLLVFDVLELDGVNLMPLPLTSRLEVLAALALPAADPGHLEDAPAGSWLQTVPLAPELAPAVEVSRAIDGEGVLAKRKDSKYLPGKRTPAWVKVKHLLEVRVVIGGWTAGKGRREGGIGSLLIGTYDDDGALRYAGKVGTGFGKAGLARMLELLTPLEIGESPFADEVPRADARNATWVAPEFGGEVLADEWTDDGRLRVPRWSGDVEPVSAAPPVAD